MESELSIVPMKRHVSLTTAGHMTRNDQTSPISTIGSTKTTAGVGDRRQQSSLDDRGSDEEFSQGLRTGPQSVRFPDLVKTRQLYRHRGKGDRA